MDSQSSCLLFLTSVFIFSVAALEGQDKHLPTIHVINSMPKDSEPIQLLCASKYTHPGSHQLPVGEDYQLEVQEKAVYFCEAVSGRLIASWHGLQPRRDGNHMAVFWLVKKDGFFLSWDNSSWVKKFKWGTL